jgi:enterochelin esterase-like enzyme
MNGSRQRGRRAMMGAAVIVAAVALSGILLSNVGPPVVGDQSVAPLALPTPTSPSAVTSPNTVTAAPLWKNWHPAGNLPATGTIGAVHIPPSVSGFAARAAQVYLPPAALVANAPALPFVLMMMGQPGDPDAGPIGGVLDRFAAAHNGLAPIVVVADQLGDPDVDSLCLDTAQYGNVETYLERDVVGWAQANLHIESDRVAWTVAGFSNGGQCAISLASKYPDVWGNVVSASGTPYPGIESEADVLQEVFGDDQDAYDAIKPATVMANTTYPDTTAIFTVGSNDDFIRANLKDLSNDARAEGMHVTYREVPGEGHTTGALIGGLTRAFEVLYPRLGLAAPAMG